MQESRGFFWGGWSACGRGVGDDAPELGDAWECGAPSPGRFGGTGQSTASGRVLWYERAVGIDQQVGIDGDHDLFVGLWIHFPIASRL